MTVTSLGHPTPVLSSKSPQRFQGPVENQGPLSLTECSTIEHTGLWIEFLILLALPLSLRGVVSPEAGDSSPGNAEAPIVSTPRGVSPIASPKHLGTCLPSPLLRDPGDTPCPLDTRSAFYPTPSIYIPGLSSFQVGLGGAQTALPC